MHRFTAAVHVAAFSLALVSCGTAPATPGLAFNPSCALVVGEIAMDTSVAAAWHIQPPSPRLLISERRGPPADAQWRYLGDHHKPPVLTSPPAQFTWPTIMDVAETAVRTPQGYQVHVVMSTWAQACEKCGT
jgi:hypothetical protein